MTIIEQVNAKLATFAAQFGAVINQLSIRKLEKVDFETFKTDELPQTVAVAVSEQIAASVEPMVTNAISQSAIIMALQTQMSGVLFSLGNTVASFLTFRFLAEDPANPTQPLNLNALFLQLMAARNLPLESKKYLLRFENEGTIEHSGIVSAMTALDMIEISYNGTQVTGFAFSDADISLVEGEILDLAATFNGEITDPAYQIPV